MKRPAGMPHGRPLRRRHGMTLIEAVIALMLLGTGIVILTTGAAQALSVARIARHYSQAQHLLALVDFEIPVESAYELYSAPESGDFNTPFEEYRWMREAEYFGPEEDQLFLVRTRIYWSDRGEESYEESLMLQRDTEAPVSTNVRDSEASAAAAGGGGTSGAASTTTPTRPGMRVRSVTTQPRSGTGSARDGRASSSDRRSRLSRGDRPAPGTREDRETRAGDSVNGPGAASGRWRPSGPGGRS